MTKENISVDSNDFSLTGSDKPYYNSLECSGNNKFEVVLDNMISG